MTTKTEDQERAAFEAAYASAYPMAASRPDKFDREDWGDYVDASIGIGWCMWQAGRAVMRAVGQSATSAEIRAWKERFPKFAYRPQDECVALKFDSGQPAAARLNNEPSITLQPAASEKPSDEEILAVAAKHHPIPAVLLLLPEAEKLTVGHFQESTLDFARALLARYGQPAASAEPTRCEDCPPVGYPTDKTRCAPCDRRAVPVEPKLDTPDASTELETNAGARRALEVADDLRRHCRCYIYSYDTMLDAAKLLEQFAAIWSASVSDRKPATEDQHTQDLASGDLIAIAEEAGGHRIAENVVEVTREDLTRIISAAPVAQEPEKRWPFVETPGQFTERLNLAIVEFGDLLAAVRNVLIENPPTFVAPVVAQAPASARGDDLVLVPRDLIASACSAIDKKRGGVKTLAELRRYTTGDLSTSAVAHAQPAEYHKRLFEAAIRDLAAISENLGLDPDEGGAVPILEAINELRRGRDDWIDAQYVAQVQPVPEGWKWMTHPACFGGKPFPVQFFTEDGVGYYRPFDESGTDFVVAEMDDDWREIAAAGAQK